MELSIIQKNIIIQNIKKEIEIIEKQLFTNYKEIKQVENSNEFLNLVKNDYNNYYDYIIKLKKEQQNHLNNLANYIKQSMLEKGLSEISLMSAERQHEDIVTELDNIKVFKLMIV